MPYEKGGRADKKGNKYEINCIVYEVFQKQISMYLHWMKKEIRQDRLRSSGGCISITIQN